MHWNAMRISEFFVYRTANVTLDIQEFSGWFKGLSLTSCKWFYVQVSSGQNQLLLKGLTILFWLFFPSCNSLLFCVFHTATSGDQRRARVNSLNESSSSLQCGQYLELLYDCLLTKKDSVVRYVVSNVAGHKRMNKSLVLWSYKDTRWSKISVHLMITVQ
jgi:hypothetical protein